MAQSASQGCRPLGAVRVGASREEKLMSVEETQHVLDEYLDALLGGGDFGSFFRGRCALDHHGDW